MSPVVSPSRPLPGNRVPFSRGPGCSLNVGAVSQCSPIEAAAARDPAAFLAGGSGAKVRSLALPDLHPATAGLRLFFPCPNHTARQKSLRGDPGFAHSSRNKQVSPGRPPLRFGRFVVRAGRLGAKETGRRVFLDEARRPLLPKPNLRQPRGGRRWIRADLVALSGHPPAAAAPRPGSRLLRRKEKR